MEAALTSSSYLKSEARSSSAIATDLRQVLQCLNVTGDVILVGSGIGALHTRVMASEIERVGGVELKGLVFVEPIVEGTAAEHAAINPSFGLEQR